MATVHLKWKESNEHEVGHKIYRSLVPMNQETPPTPIAVVGADITYYYDNTAEINKTYYYMVSAFNNTFESFSRQIKVETYPYPPKGILAAIYFGTASRFNPGNTSSITYESDFVTAYDDFNKIISPLFKKIGSTPSTPVGNNPFDPDIYLSNIVYDTSFTFGVYGIPDGQNWLSNNGHFIKLFLKDGDGNTKYVLNFCYEGQRMSCIISGVTGNVVASVRFETNEYSSRKTRSYEFSFNQDGFYYVNSDAVSATVAMDLTGITEMWVGAPRTVGVNNGKLPPKAGVYIAVGSLEGVPLGVSDVIT